MPPFASAVVCENGKVTVLAMVDDLNKTKVTGGQSPFRESVSRFLHH